MNQQRILFLLFRSAPLQGQRLCLAGIPDTGPDHRHPAMLAQIPPIACGLGQRHFFGARLTVAFHQELIGAGQHPINTAIAAES